MISSHEDNSAIEDKKKKQNTDPYPYAKHMEVIMVV